MSLDVALDRISARVRAESFLNKNIHVIGTLVLAAKAGLRHGEFGLWLNKEFGNRRSMEKYMAVAQAFTAAEYEALRAIGARDVTLHHLARPRLFSPEDRATILEMVASGEITSDQELVSFTGCPR